MNSRHVSTDITILNPLPEALAHYEASVLACLESAGRTVQVLPSTNISVASTGASRATTATRALAERLLSAPRISGRLLVLWPAFGYLDRLLWSAGPRVSIVFHDPTKLRRQFGLSKRSSKLGTLRSDSRAPGIVVHSEQARQDVLARGLRVESLVPLPMLRPRPSWRPEQTVTVLGQFKSARDVAVLEDMGPALRLLGLRPVIRGRGWPQVPGWDVVDGFLSEFEFDRHIVTSAAIVIPYKKVFQSDVAVRAAELGVPVVGPRESNVVDLFGSDWPGVLSSDANGSAWAHAVQIVSAMPSNEVERRVSNAFRDVETAWHAWALEPEYAGNTSTPSGVPRRERRPR